MIHVSLSLPANRLLSPPGADAPPAADAGDVVEVTQARAKVFSSIRKPVFILDGDEVLAVIEP